MNNICKSIYRIIQHISVLLLLFIHYTVLSHAASTEIHVDRFGVEDGLSDNTVTSICKDFMGMMWFGTTNGLNRFDAYNYVHFKHDPSDSTSISDNYIQALFVSKNGDLWIATRSGGLNLFDSETETFISYMYDPDNPEGISSNLIFSITEGNDGVLWLGSDSGLNAFDPKTEKFTRYLNDIDDPQSLINNNVGSVLADEKGNIWVGTNYGLNMITHDTGILKHFPDTNPKTSQLNKNIIDITEGNDGTLWLSTWGGGLRKFDINTGAYEVFLHDPTNPRSIGSNIIGHMSIDNAGKLWFGTQHGLESIDITTYAITHYDHDPKNQFTVSSNGIWAVYSDDSGIIWVGTLNGGGNKIVPSKSIFRFYDFEKIHQGATTGGTIEEFCQYNSLIWLGSSLGLHSFNQEKEEFDSYMFSDSYEGGINSLIFRTLFNDLNGKIWLGTGIAGLVCFDIDTGSFTSFLPNMLSSSVATFEVSTINKDAHGMLWLGTNVGIMKFDPRTESFSEIEIVKGENSELNGTSNILFDSDSSIVWLAGLFGLAQYDKDNNNLQYIISNDKSDIHLSSQAIVSLLNDRQEMLWLGTQNGLYSYDKGTKILTKYKLPNDTIHDMQQDENGNIWVSTNIGLSCVKLSSNEVISYDSGDGLPISHGAKQTLFRAKDGALFVSSQNGFYTFHPDSIHVSNTPPPLVLTSLKIDNVDAVLETNITELSEISIPYSRGPISFEFSALDYINPDKNIYEYKMEGLNDNWIQSGNVRIVTYTNLASGSYLFRVKAANSRGVWTTEGISVKVNIIPPFWGTLWFRIIILTLIVGIVFAVFEARIFVMKRNSERLNSVVELRTAELAESEQRFRDLTDLLPQTVFELDMKGNFTFSNRYGLESTGYSAEDIAKGVNAIHMFVKEDRKRVLKNIQKVLSGEQFDDHEYTVRKKDGSSYPALIYTNPIIHGGAPTGIRGIVIDISERVTAEEKLKEIKERWHYALEGGEEGVWDWNIQTNDVFLSARWKEMLGFKEHEINNAYEEWDIRLHPDDKAVVYEDINKHIEGETPIYRNEHRVLCKDGSYKWILERGKVMSRTSDGKPLRMVGTHTDITERKDSEHALRDSEEMMRMILESATEGIVVVDHRGHISMMNEAAEAMFGYHKDEAHGKPIETLIPENIHGKHVGYCADYREKPAPRPMGAELNLLARRKDGSAFPVEIGLNGFNIKGDIHIIAMVNDITERRKAEEKIALQSAELQRSNTELEQFAYIASHDLQEPLRKVQAFGSRLESIIGDGLSEKGADYLQRMQNAANRMRDLIESLLSYSRITTKAQPFLPVDLNEIIGDVIQDLEFSIEKSGGKVDVGILPTINGDRIQLSQLLQNIIGNGLKYHREDAPPVITVSGRCVDGKERIYEICVEDNGIGIDKKYFDRIMQPFQRLHGKGRFEGTGIGLAICKKIVERHEGTITISSTVGEGSTFTMSFPPLPDESSKGQRL